MPVFQYEAIDKAGKSRRGVIESGSQAGARQALRARDLLPVSVGPNRATRSRVANDEDSPAPARANLLSRLRGNGISSAVLSNTTRQLATLISSGVRIDDALRIVSNEGDNPALTAVLTQVRSSVLEGSSFAGALARHPDIFPGFYTASIQAGEQSSRLPAVLLYLAEFVEARHAAGRKLQLALLYPALLAIISALIMTVMMIYVVPDIVQVFISRGADLPLPTRILIAMSTLLTSYGWIILIVMAIGLFVGYREFSKPERRQAFDRMLATRRPFAAFSRQINSARFAATLATLVQSAVPLLDALNASAAVVPNRYFRSRGEFVAEQVREGGSLNRAMRDAQVFPSMLVAIVASGEAGRNLGTALERAAAELDREVDGQVQVLVSLVEPMVLLAMGGMVLMMVMAILMPIIGLNDLALS